MTYRRMISSALLAAGGILVFVGLTAALGFTPVGMLASAAVMATLLYAGAVWFAPSVVTRASEGAASVIVFDRSQRIVAGGRLGEPVAGSFPESVRAEIVQRCGAALAGMTARFECELAGQLLAFDAVPVRRADGIILYGILLSGAGSPASAAATTATTVA
jgi:hypothetical protein